MTRDLNASAHTDHSRNAGSIDALVSLQGSGDTSAVLVSEMTMHTSHGSTHILQGIWFLWEPAVDIF